MQIVLAFTFLMQALEFLRVYPLGVAFARRFIGPNITAKDRSSVWGLLYPLENPPEFWHAETFAQLILFYMVFFVYSTISPVTCFFLAFCFLLSEIGYAYQLIHNYPRAFETGGKLWFRFVHFTQASMVIAELTLIGLLALKQSVYAGPAMGPLLAFTLLFVFYINHARAHVAEHLPTYRCVETDEARTEAGETNASYCCGVYVQPSLQQPHIEPEYESAIGRHAIESGDCADENGDVHLQRRDVDAEYEPEIDDQGSDPETTPSQDGAKICEIPQRSTFEQRSCLDPESEVNTEGVENDIGEEARYSVLRELQLQPVSEDKVTTGNDIL